MNERNEEELRRLLRSAIVPLERPALEHDLWPRMLATLDRKRAAAGWFDAALAALAVAWFFLFPGAIPWMLYQL